MIKPYMHRWQRCLATEIEASLQVREGPPPLSAMRHRARMLHLFAGEGAIGVLRWLMMSVLPNGRWWLTDRVEVFVAAVPADSRRLATSIAAGMVRALASVPPPLWPRHRWVGHDVALDWIGLQEACHKLCTRTALRFISWSSSSVLHLNAFHMSWNGVMPHLNPNCLKDPVRTCQRDAAALAICDAEPTVKANENDDAANTTFAKETPGTGGLPSGFCR